LPMTIETLFGTIRARVECTLKARCTSCAKIKTESKKESTNETS